MKYSSILVIIFMFWGFCFMGIFFEAKFYVAILYFLVFNPIKH